MQLSQLQPLLRLSLMQVDPSNIGDPKNIFTFQTQIFPIL